MQFLDTLWFKFFSVSSQVLILNFWQSSYVLNFFVYNEFYPIYTQSLFRIAKLDKIPQVLKMPIIFSCTGKVSKHLKLKSNQSCCPHQALEGLSYICLQLFSSIACFVQKPAHFAFLSYGGACRTLLTRLSKKIYTFLAIVSLLRSLSIRKQLI